MTSQVVDIETIIPSSQSHGLKTESAWSDVIITNAKGFGITLAIKNHAFFTIVHSYMFWFFSPS